jgi:hypothetical protein
MRKPFLREMHGGFVTEWYCRPPPWGMALVVTSQSWADDIRRIYAWVPADAYTGPSRVFDCDGYQLQVVESWE